MKNKVIIITGGSSGIGKALASEFGRKGNRIVVTGRNTEQLQQTAEVLTSEGIEVLPLQADVSKEADNASMVQETLKAFGSIDVLINNAGISMRARFEEVDLEVIRRLMEINFFGVVYATKHCLPEIRRAHGSIVGISSIAGFRGLPGRTGYSASKFALNGFLESLRTELLDSGVHVLTACPGFTTSNIRERALMKDGTPQGSSPRDEAQMMSAEECARRIYRATVRRKRTLVLTTKGKLAVVANKWLPSFTDRMVYKEMQRESRGEKT